MNTTVMPGQKSILVAYALWAAGGLGLVPLYWFYLGKVPVMRILTLNWLWIGGIIDLLKIPQYVSDHNRGVR
jgi:hypothetical protein